MARTIKVNADVARTFLARFRGLMLRNSAKKPLLITNANSIHTFFMRFPIEAAFLNSENVVLDIRMLQPWRLTKSRRNVKRVLEFNPGTLDIVVGDQLEIVE